MRTAILFLLFLVLNVKAQRATIHTDSSVIVSGVYPGGREVKEIANRSHLTYWKFYRNNDKVITSTALYNPNGVLIGIASEYDDKGNLLYQIDYNKGYWLVKDRKKHPFFQLQRAMKLRADSLITALYGKDFLATNAVWNVGSSAIYNSKESGNWTDNFKVKPTEFLFRYNLKLDSRHVYPDLLEFRLDAHGHLIPENSEVIWNGALPLATTKKRFAISYAFAIAEAKRRGLVEGNKNKTSAFLQWETTKQKGLINNELRFYVSIKTASMKDIHLKGRSSITNKFEVYSFNPWTGKFIEKKTMKSIDSWEAMSGSSTGLIPAK